MGVPELSVLNQNNLNPIVALSIVVGSDRGYRSPNPIAGLSTGSIEDENQLGHSQVESYRVSQSKSWYSCQ